VAAEGDIPTSRPISRQKGLVEKGERNSTFGKAARTRKDAKKTHSEKAIQKGNKESRNLKRIMFAWEREAGAVKKKRVQESVTGKILESKAAKKLKKGNEERYTRASSKGGGKRDDPGSDLKGKRPVQSRDRDNSATKKKGGEGVRQ